MTEVKLLLDVVPIDEDAPVLGSQISRGYDLYASGTNLPMPSSLTTTDAIILARTAEVAQVMLTGVTHHNVITWIQSQYNVCRDSARALWLRARDMIQRECNEALHLALAEQLLARRALRMASDDPVFILRCLDSEAKILGLGNLIRHEITGRDGGPIETTISEGSLIFHDVIDQEDERG